MTDNLHGFAHKYGDNIDTDVIIPARYCSSFAMKDMAPHCLEDLDKDFVKKVNPGDVLVAGKNFGCGSSRENAPLAIKGAGVSAVIAASFARIFFRNAVNVGLPVLESPEAASRIATGDELYVDLHSGIITNLSKNEKYESAGMPELVREIFQAGGMVPFVKKRLAGR